MAEFGVVLFFLEGCAVAGEIKIDPTVLQGWEGGSE